MKSIVLLTLLVSQTVHNHFFTTVSCRILAICRSGLWLCDITQVIWASKTRLLVEWVDAFHKLVYGSDINYLSSRGCGTVTVIAMFIVVR